MSERTAWENVFDLARQMSYGVSVQSEMHKLATRIMGTADGMLGQLAQGHHENPGRERTNPPLVVWMNPPSRDDDVMSQNVHDLAYVHEEDGKPYRHKFSRGVDLVSMSRGEQRYLALIRPDGRPLWEDF
jgi:hypothetical protein